MKIVKAECIDPAMLTYRFHGGVAVQAFDYASGVREWVPVPAEFKRKGPPDNFERFLRLKWPACGDVLVLVE